MDLQSVRPAATGDGEAPGLEDVDPDGQPGGAGVVAHALARGVSGSGAEVHVVSTHRQRGQGVVRDAGEFPVYRIASRYPHRFVAYFGLWNPMTVPTVARLLDEIRPDVVHAHNVHGHLSYASLRAAHRRGLPVMLTAHTLSVEDTVKSYREGAASYIPKEEIANITTYLNDIFEAKEKGKPFYWRWLERFASYYDKKFGPDWQEGEKEFWEKFKYLM